MIDRVIFLVLGARYSTPDVLICEGNDCEPCLVGFVENRDRDKWNLPEEIIVNALQCGSEDVDDSSRTLSTRCARHIVFIQQGVVLVALLS